MPYTQTHRHQTTYPGMDWVGTYYHPYIGRNMNNNAVFENGTEFYSGYIDPRLELMETPQVGVDVQTSAPDNLQQVTPKVSKRDLYNQNQGGGISTQEAYRRQKLLRENGFNVTYDGYYGDASKKAWAEYQASLTPKMETPSLTVAPSVTKSITTTKATDPNSPEANRQRFLDEQAAKIATAKMPSQFSNIDIMGAMKAEEARKKAELEALMQQQGAGSKLLNTDPHNIQGGYVVPVEPLYDMSKLDTHNQFGLKFQQGGNIGSNNINLENYKGSPDINNRKMIDNINPFYGLYQSGGMIPKYQNASSEELKEKPKMISISGPNYNETMVEGTDSTGTNKYQFREIEQQGDTTKVLYMRDPKTGQIIALPADSRFNKDFEWMIRNAEPVNEYKKGGSLKKCSCGCKTLLKRGKGGKVMESKNCK